MGNMALNHSHERNNAEVVDEAMAPKKSPR